MSAAFLEFSEDAHAYYVDGRRQYSVTEVLVKSGLVSPFSQRDEQARWRGDSVHKLCAKLDLEGKLDLRSVPAELRPYLRAWIQFKKDVGIQRFVAHEIEHRVDSVAHGFSGRVDRLSCWSRTMVGCNIIDLKTGAIPAWTRLQLSGYGIAIKPDHCFGRIAVGLKPDGKYTVRQYPRADYLKDAAEFLRLLNQVKKENQDGSRITE